MAYGTLYLTSQGMELASKTLLSKAIQFTKFAVGSGTLENDNVENIRDLTHLINQVSIFNITKISRNSNNQITVKGLFKNTDVANDFYLHEVGLFAKDLDTGQEILFAYVNYGDEAEYINTSQEQKQEFYYDLIIKVDNSGNVVIEINSETIYATEKDLLEITPRRKILTLLSTNWTLNSATNKYEYIIEDSNITENDFPDCALSEEEKKKISDLDQFTENGRLILTTSKQVTENINMTVVLIRTIAESEVE